MREAQKKYISSGAIKRVPLDMKKEFYDELKQMAESKGIPVNTFIKQAISEKMNSYKE